MKKLFFVLVLAFYSILSAQTSGSVEFMNRTSTKFDKVTPHFNLYVRGDLIDNLDWTAWSLNSKAWSESYLGLIYSPTQWMEASASYGLETGGERYGSSLWIGVNGFSTIVIHENGKSGWWYKSVGTYNITESMKIGYHSQRKVGTGPYVSYKLGPVTVWGSYLFESSNTVFVSTKLTF